MPHAQAWRVASRCIILAVFQTPEERQETPEAIGGRANQEPPLLGPLLIEEIRPVRAAALESE